MYEHYKEPLISKLAFIKRLFFHLSLSLLIVGSSLLIGIFGYHCLEKFSWTDAFLNASMLLSGMGPVSELRTEEGKLFASFYALFSGIVFISVISIVIIPVIHRFLHKFHLQEE